MNMVHIVPSVGETVTPGGDRNSGLGATCGGLLDGSHLLGGASGQMHSALKDWLRLEVGGAENADMPPGTILVGTAFVGHVIVAANGFTV